MEYRQLYDENYYKTSLGTNSYLDSEHWVSFFGRIADKIIESLHPVTVLDVGCAFGYLVTALRDRGVDAYGIDVSEYAISKVREDIKPFCRACSALEPLPSEFLQKYDLVVTIEVAEHLYEEDGIKFIENICKYSNTVIFSSTPEDITEKTHFNVQQAEYWAKRFVESSFIKELVYDASFIAPQAFLFVKRNYKLDRIVEDYERNIRILKNELFTEVHERNNKIIHLNALLTEKEMQVLNLEKASEAKDTQIGEIGNIVTRKQEENIRHQNIIAEKDIRILELAQTNQGLQKQMDWLEQSQAHMQVDNDKFRHEIIEREARILDLVQTNQSLQKQMDQLQQSLAYIQVDSNNFQNNIIERDTRIQELVQINQGLQKQMDRLKQSLACEQEDNDRYQNVIAERDARINEFIQASNWLHGEVARWQSSFTIISGSSCWHLTKPLRFILDTLKSIGRHLLHNTLTRYAKKLITSIRMIGVKNTLRKVKHKLRGQPDIMTGVNFPASQNEAYDENVDFLLNKRLRDIQPIQTVIVGKDSKRLNFVTDSIDSHSLLGGVATALIVATEFASQNNMSLRIITRNTPANPVNYENIMRISGILAARNVTYYSDYDRDVLGNIAYKLEVSENDIFLATSWWSATAIKRTSLCKKFFYIIQEVETFFYPHGDEHYLCSQIMQDENIHYIINSHYLYEYFKVNEPNIVRRGVYFEPAFPKALFQPQPFTHKKKYKLFFYARPNNPRNMFNYGVNILEKSIESGVLDTNEWDIYCAGQSIPELKFTNGYIANSLGLMSWQEYSKFLGGVDLALSLMYTPHPSYPPFDVACSGGVVISNFYDNKESFDWCKNVIFCSMEEEEFLKSMAEAIALAKDIPLRQENYENSTIPRTWQDTLVSTLKFMEEKLENV